MSGMHKFTAREERFQISSKENETTLLLQEEAKVVQPFRVKDWTGSLSVPAAFAMFPADISHAPREWAERFFNVQRWTEMPRGGHFAALEEPELLVNDIQDFFRPFRASV